MSAVKGPGDAQGGTGETPEQPTPEQLARQVAARSGVQRRGDGQVDVLATIGGLRGLVEAIGPGLIFIVVFTVTQQLDVALIGALGIAAVLTIIRLIQRQSLTQALAGLAGVVICALFARTTGAARDFYVPGFLTNVGYGAALIISIFVKWPLMGVVFGFIRGEGLDWRQAPARVRAYSIATWIIVAVFTARLAVQLPLYYASADDGGALTALGSARLIMGVPLYAMGLWLAWMLSRPREARGPVA
ncbi:DUF3159 domain-containing protein [Zhihengliuella halotolerans]|uniref:Uncharacterized protein DUF3159 n=1 Tax=Zhihengliuella halotolerans TaxID=370736 RepID=A0A4Q8AC38_9MICC|nr:DUF3159 domain-containing protein [Zhihengliuella halotolerans]RZU61153.1 uncharacterized protein DUF3159 [Zhihengliuella halotolerans]